MVGPGQTAVGRRRQMFFLIGAETYKPLASNVLRSFCSTFHVFPAMCGATAEGMHVARCSAPLIARRSVFAGVIHPSTSRDWLSMLSSPPPAEAPDAALLRGALFTDL